MPALNAIQSTHNITLTHPPAMGLLQPVLTSLSAVLCSGPVHLLCFSTLLGTQLYQTFVLTKITFRALARQPFVTLQARVFPAYFRIQTALLLLTALTWPPHSVLSLAEAKTHWIPLVVGMATSVLNLLLFGPRTRKAMLDLAQLGMSTLYLQGRRAQLTRRTGRENKPDDAEQPGLQAAAIKKTFRKNHAASIHLNLITLGATLWHGWLLASKLQF